MSGLSSMLMSDLYRQGRHGSWQSLATELELAVTGFDAFDDDANEEAVRLARIQMDNMAVLSVIGECERAYDGVEQGRQTALRWTSFANRLRAYAEREHDAYARGLLAGAETLIGVISQGTLTRHLDALPIGERDALLRGLSCAGRRLHGELVEEYVALLGARLERLATRGEMTPADLWFVLLGGMEVGGQTPWDIGAGSLKDWASAARPLGEAPLRIVREIAGALRAQRVVLPEVSAASAMHQTQALPRLERLPAWLGGEALSEQMARWARADASDLEVDLGSEQ